MLANEILLTATDTIRDRGLSYGHPADNLQHTAQHIDNWIDMASYAALAGQLATEENDLYV